jgi:hypothetical protein
MFDFVVIDDVISKKYQNIIEQTTLAWPWCYQPNIATGKYFKENATIGFCHALFNEGKALNEHFHPLFPLLLEGCEKANINFTHLLRTQSFMHVPHQPANKYDGPHINIPDPHIVGLYYVNDSDGDTVLFNQTWDDLPYGQLTNESLLTEYKRISPKKGRMVFFNGQYYHASSNPELDRRCIINFNVR